MNPQPPFDAIVFLKELQLGAGMRHRSFWDFQGNRTEDASEAGWGKILQLRETYGERPIVPAHVPADTAILIDKFIGAAETLIGNKDFNIDTPHREKLKQSFISMGKGLQPHPVAGAEALPAAEGQDSDARMNIMYAAWNQIAEYVLSSETVKDCLFKHLGDALVEVSNSCLILKFKSDSSSILVGQESLTSFFPSRFVDIFHTALTFTTREIILKELPSTTNLEGIKFIIDQLIDHTYLFLIVCAQQLTTDASSFNIMLALSHEIHLDPTRKVDVETFVDVAMKERKQLNPEILEAMKSTALEYGQEQEAAAYEHLIELLEKEIEKTQRDPQKLRSVESEPSTSKELDPMKPGTSAVRKTTSKETGVASYSSVEDIELYSWATTHLPSGGILHGGSYGLVGLDFTPELSTTGTPKISSLAVCADQVYVLHYVDPAYHLDIVNLTTKKTQRSDIRVSGSFTQNVFSRVAVSKAAIYISVWMTTHIKVFDVIAPHKPLYDIQLEMSPTSLELLPDETLLVGLEEGIVVRIKADSEYTEMWNSGPCLDGSRPQSVIYEEKNDVVLVGTNDSSLYQLNYKGDVKKWNLVDLSELMDMDLYGDDLNVTTWSGKRFQYSLNQIRSTSK